MNIEAKYTVEFSTDEFMRFIKSDYQRLTEKHCMLYSVVSCFSHGDSEQESIDHYSIIIDDALEGPMMSKPINKSFRYDISGLQINLPNIDKDHTMARYEKIVREFYSLDQKTKMAIASLLNIDFNE